MEKKMEKRGQATFSGIYLFFLGKGGQSLLVDSSYKKSSLFPFILKVKN